jgi:hypothetical protein
MTDNQTDAAKFVVRLLLGAVIAAGFAALLWYSASRF